MFCSTLLLPWLMPGCWKKSENPKWSASVQPSKQCPMPVFALSLTAPNCNAMANQCSWLLLVLSTSPKVVWHIHTYIRQWLGCLKSQSLGAEASSDQSEQKHLKFTFETVTSNFRGSECNWQIVPNSSAGSRKTSVAKTCKCSGNNTSSDIWRPKLASVNRRWKSSPR